MTDDNNQVNGQEPVNNAPVEDVAPAADEVTDEELENYSNDELLDAYVAQLIKDKGVEDLDGSKQAELKDKLVRAINNAIVDELPEDKVNELNSKFDQNEATPEAVSQVVADSGVDTQGITERVMDAFRENYLKNEE